MISSPFYSHSRFCVMALLGSFVWKVHFFLGLSERWNKCVVNRSCVDRGALLEMNGWTGWREQRKRCRHWQQAGQIAALLWVHFCSRISFIHCLVPTLSTYSNTQCRSYSCCGLLSVIKGQEPVFKRSVHQNNETCTSLGTAMQIVSVSEICTSIPIQ